MIILQQGHKVVLRLALLFYLFIAFLFISYSHFFLVYTPQCFKSASRMLYERKRLFSQLMHRYSWKKIGFSTLGRIIHVMRGTSLHAFIADYTIIVKKSDFRTISVNRNFFFENFCKSDNGCRNDVYLLSTSERSFRPFYNAKNPS